MHYALTFLVSSVRRDMSSYSACCVRRSS